MVSGIVAAMLSINPQLEPEQVRMLLRHLSSFFPIHGKVLKLDGRGKRVIFLILIIRSDDLIALLVG